MEVARQQQLLGNTRQGLTEYVRTCSGHVLYEMRLFEKWIKYSTGVDRICEDLLRACAI